MANLFQIRNIQNSQTRNQNRFTLRFNNLDSILDKAKNHRLSGVVDRYNAVKNVIYKGDFTLAQTLELSLLTCSVPNIQIETQRIKRFNDSVAATTMFAEPEDMTVTFYDYVNGSASAIMLLWQALVGDKKTGALGFKEDFILRTAHLFMYGPDAPGYSDTELASKYLEKHEVINIFPKGVNLGEHTYESGEARRVEVTFSIDNIYPVEYKGYDATNQVIG